LVCTSPVAHGKSLQIESGLLSDSFDDADGLRRGDATKNTPMSLERMKHMQHQQPLSWISIDDGNIVWRLMHQSSPDSFLHSLDSARGIT